jgi:hypothetical protein
MLEKGGVGGAGLLASSIVVHSVVVEFEISSTSQKKGFGGTGGGVEVKINVFGCRDGL